MISYKIIKSPPYDKDASSSFWIKKEVKVLGITVSSKLIGDYEIDDTYGKLGQMPFFCKKQAKKRLKILNK